MSGSLTRHASADGQPVYLLAALDQRCGVVLGQVRVDGKTNEITRFAPLLEPLDLAGCVITADALHTQREHAEFLVTGKGAHYILVMIMVKKNQPGLYAQVKNLPWRRIPVASRQHDRGHGRQEHRTLKAAAVAAGLAFPHAAQAICLTRQIRPLDGGRWRTVTDPRNPRTVPSMNKTDMTRPRRGPGGCCTHLPYLHRLALEDGEVAGRGLRSLR